MHDGTAVDETKGNMLDHHIYLDLHTRFGAGKIDEGAEGNVLGLMVDQVIGAHEEDLLVQNSLDDVLIRDHLGRDIPHLRPNFPDLDCHDWLLQGGYLFYAKLFFC